MEKYFLHINEPCTEDWNSMTTVEKGKFCSHCNKTIFDFTTATEGEIVKHIEAMKGEMFCGRFEENQLDRWIERSDIKTSNPRLYKFLISFMLLGAAQHSSAQVPTAQEKVVTKRTMDSLLNLQNISSETGITVCDRKAKGIKVIVKDRIRMGGVRTLTGTQEPLIIVDGIRIKYSLINSINPNNILEVNVLKSPNSTAIYGPDGVNGAIIILTKYTKRELKKLIN